MIPYCGIINAVLLIDEFQEVERVASNQGIEDAIRHVAQETKNFALLRIIFTGDDLPTPLMK